MCGKGMGWDGMTRLEPFSILPFQCPCDQVFRVQDIECDSESASGKSRREKA